MDIHPSKTGIRSPRRLAGLAAAALLLACALACCDPSGGDSRPPRELQKEAQANLRALAALQKSYKNAHGGYAVGPDCFERLGWSYQGKSRWSYYCGEDGIERNDGSIDCEHHFVNPGTPEKFFLYAVGNIDKDILCDVWRLDSTGDLIHFRNDDAN